MMEEEEEYEYESDKDLYFRLELFKNTILEEEEIISAIDLCGIISTFGAVTNFEKVTPGGVEVLYQGKNYHFYDASYMQYLACLFKNTFTKKKDDNHEVVNKFLVPGKRIGEASLSGQVTSISFQNDVDMLKEFAVVKTVRSIYDDGDPEQFFVFNAELIHEYFVGLRLNGIRHYVTNFMFVYAIFGCVPSLSDDELCDVSEDDEESMDIQKNHLLIEYIDGPGALSAW
ncbi:MAG: hypothetical protein ACMG6E_10430, partial [Candidatus Roizmanbacteria bacterium]